MIKRILIGAALTLFVLVAALLLVVQSAWVRGIAERQIEKLTGREVSIGRLDIDLRRCLRIEADEVRIGNPDWAEREHLLNARHVSACLAWLPLLTGTARVKSAALIDAELNLERDSQGRATWAIGAEQKEEKDEPPPIINNVRLSNVLIHFRDAGLGAELQLRAEGGTPEQPDVAVRAQGRVHETDVHAVLHSPAALPSPEAPVMVSLALTLDRTTAAVAGRLTSLGIDGLDMQLSIAGDSLAALNKLGKIELPDTPPYALRGRLRNRARDHWQVDGLAGRYGDSDVAGHFALELRETRPFFSGEFDVKLLDLDDVLPLVGAAPKTGPGETASAAQRAKAQTQKRDDTIFPDKPLSFTALDILDADVRFRAEQVRRPDAVPINALAGHLTVDNGTVRVQPLDFEVAGGKVATALLLEGRAKPPRASASMDVRQVNLAKLLPDLQKEDVAVGTLYGRGRIEGHGASVAKLLGSADGDVTLMVDGGEMSALVLEAAGLDIAEVVKFLTIKGKPVPLRCAILDLHIENGLAQSELFVLDTDDTVFIGEGHVNFANEEIDVTIHPRPKDESILALRTPLHLSGTLADPSAGIKGGKLAAKGVAAVALGLVNPLLAILPLIETGPGQDSDCGQFSRRAQTEPKKNAPAENEREKARAAGQEQRSKD